MKGLLIKDFKMAKKHGTILFLISAIFFFVALLSNQSMYFSYYSVAMLSIMPTTIMAYDETSKWNKIEAVLPISKSKIVIEKYIFVLICVVPAIVIECLLFYLIQNFSFSSILSLGYLMLFSGLIVPIIILPITFRFGYLKSKLIGGLIAGILTCSITVINMRNITGETMIDGYFTPQKDAFLVVVLTIVLMIISLGLSVVLYEKREF